MKMIKVDPFWVATSIALIGTTVIGIVANVKLKGQEEALKTAEALTCEYKEKAKEKIKESSDENGMILESVVRGIIDGYEEARINDLRTYIIWVNSVQGNFIKRDVSYTAFQNYKKGMGGLQ